MFLNIIKELLKEMKRNDACWCGSGKKYKKCHLDFDEKIDSIKFDKNNINL